MTPLTGKMGRMSARYIHEERLETLRKLAVERLRACRAYRCPHCGYQSFQMACPHFGAVCEFLAQRPS